MQENRIDGLHFARMSDLEKIRDLISRRIIYSEKKGLYLGPLPSIESLLESYSKNIERNEMLVYITNNKVTGMVVVKQSSPNWEYDETAIYTSDLFTDEDYPLCAREIITALTAYFRRIGVKKCRADYYAINSTLGDLYSLFGFKKHSVVKNNNGDELQLIEQIII